MSISDLITIIVALYGAVLSTILGLRELRRERRRISIILEHVAWYERAQITIINTGHRPITVTEIGMSVYFEQGGRGGYDRVPRNALFGHELEVEPFPVTIRDGESITLPLSPLVSEALLGSRMKAEVTVYDVEGNEYKEFRTRMYDPKWGAYIEPR